MPRRQFLNHLAHGFEERQTLDVANRAADLAQDKIGNVGIGTDVLLYDVRYVGNDLNRAAEIIATPLACQDI